MSLPSITLQQTIPAPCTAAGTAPRTTTMVNHLRHSILRANTAGSRQYSSSTIKGSLLYPEGPTNTWHHLASTFNNIVCFCWCRHWARGAHCNLLICSPGGGQQSQGTDARHCCRPEYNRTEIADHESKSLLSFVARDWDLWYCCYVTTDVRTIYIFVLAISLAIISTGWNQFMQLTTTHMVSNNTIKIIYYQ